MLVVCGMALGHADPAAPESRLRPVREPVQALARSVEVLGGEVKGRVRS